MKTNEGGSMISVILFGVSMVAFIASVVLYLLKDETYSKKWVDQTKEVIDLNKKLNLDMADTIKVIETFHNNHIKIVDELTKQKEQLAKIEYAQTLPKEPLALPSTINFTVIERRKVVQPIPTTSQKPDAKTIQVLKKVKKQMKDFEK